MEIIKAIIISFLQYFLIRQPLLMESPCRHCWSPTQIHSLLRLFCGGRTPSWRACAYLYVALCSRKVILSSARGGCVLIKLSWELLITFFLPTIVLEKGIWPNSGHEMWREACWYSFWEMFSFFTSGRWCVRGGFRAVALLTVTRGARSCVERGMTILWQSSHKRWYLWPALEYRRAFEYVSQHNMTEVTPGHKWSCTFYLVLFEHSLLACSFRGKPSTM